LNFGEELKRIRESKGMTINQLSMYSGISGASISRYETGERGIPKPPTIEKLAKGLKVDYGVLMRAAGHWKDEDPTPVSEEDPARVLKEMLELDLDDEEIMKKVNFRLDGIELTPKEIKKFLALVRIDRDTDN
jgi:transcriptional regulator with XRE-family HTH domain